MSKFPRTSVCVRALLALAIGTNLSVTPASAQSTLVTLSPASDPAVSATATALTATLGLNEAFRIALAQQPWTAAADEREREQRSREALADSWLAENPTIASGLKTGRRDGVREFEVEISAPIASASRRSLQVSTARGESAAYGANIAQHTLRLAGEVRDAFWALQIAASGFAFAEDAINRSQHIATDSARRTAAGDSARVDTLQAQANLQTSRGARIEAELRLSAARQGLRALVGDAAIRQLAEIPETRIALTPALLNAHPSQRLANHTLLLARARLNEAAALVNGAPTLSFTLGNERSNGSANSATARIGVSLPFGGDQRATPRIAQAGAELAEAQAGEQLVRRRLDAEARATQEAVVASERRAEALSERARLSDEVADLYAKAYRLGELDLATRLRVEGERAAASLALSQARIEIKHTISRANQSLGLLP